MVAVTPSAFLFRPDCLHLSIVSSRGRLIKRRDRKVWNEGGRVINACLIALLPFKTTGVVLTWWPLYSFYRGRILSHRDRFFLTLTVSYKNKKTQEIIGLVSVCPFNNTRCFNFARIMLNFSFPSHDSLACLNMHHGEKYYTFHYVHLLKLLYFFSW